MPGVRWRRLVARVVDTAIAVAAGVAARGRVAGPARLGGGRGTISRAIFVHVGFNTFATVLSLTL